MTADAGTLLRLTAPPTRVQRLALFLDLDGVLAEIRPRPEDVVAEPRRTALLRRLSDALEGRVAVVSGRTLREIDRLTDGAVTVASGAHGLERRSGDGAIDRETPHPAVAVAVERFHAFAVGKPGVIVEDKGVSAGLHYRAAPDHARAAADLAETLAGETGLALQHGKLVAELKTPGSSKGTALEALMRDPAFAGATPVMVGDDLTDEHGFEAAARLGGFGVLVGEPRETAARHILPDVAAVFAWLEAVAKEAEG